MTSEPGHPGRTLLTPKSLCPLPPSCDVLSRLNNFYTEQQRTHRLIQTLIKRRLCFVCPASCGLVDALKRCVLKKAACWRVGLQNLKLKDCIRIMRMWLCLSFSVKFREHSH